MQDFSLNGDMIRVILDCAKPMGHNEKVDSLNLGFGFLYYGLVRALRPEHVLVIGSGFGFSVVCLALGIKDNGSGTVSFVDPSYSLLKDGPFKTIGGAGNWDDPGAVEAHFGQFGVAEIVRHYRLTSERFFQDYRGLDLPQIDLAFIDGNHVFESARRDFLNVLDYSHKNTYILLHDTNIYIRELLRHAGVKRWLNIVKRAENFFGVIDFPFSSGIALVRLTQDTVWKSMEQS